MISGTGASSPQQTQDNGIKFVSPEKHASLTKDDFMKLFVTQLQYQDPMNPMNSADMSSQIAQFNMVDLMYKNNDAMKQLVESDQSRTRLEAVSYLGHEVRYKGNELQVTKDGPLPFDIKNTDPVASCVVTIKDANGALVKRWNMGALSPGKHDLGWDCTNMSGDAVKPGSYKVDIKALDKKGEKVSVTTWTSGKISRVEYPDKGLPLLSIKDGPEVALNKIRMVGP